MWTPLTLLPEAIPSNFQRSKMGDRVIRQEVQKLLLLDHERHPSKPLLTEDGRVRLKHPATGQTEVGLPWSEILERVPTYFSNMFKSVRSRESYGTAVHGYLVRLARQLSTPPFKRTAALIQIRIQRVLGLCGLVMFIMLIFLRSFSR